ncbi:hypothetical protein DFH07DRAFT_521897 [Mycena maculata]|uniref:Uncharacterized protein n=1 Tax=Mycena maculata TaxID=230809 RepID=A0AAD7IXI5_9AGAR|nr:hypothetical protein DFH07DRAFT_521897 [Mycena maculata]
MAHDLVRRGSVEEARVDRMRYAFYGLQLAGLLGAVIILLTAIIWRKAAKRHASWFNFMVTWIISCSSYLFLIGEPLDTTPNQTLCVFQAALIYSVPTLTSAATIALVIHVYMTLRSLLTPINHRAIWTAALVAGPYVPAWALFATFLMMGLSDPSLVRAFDGTYCSISNKTPERVSAIVVAALMILCLGVEAIIFRNLRRAWAVLKQDDRSSVSMVVRVLAFTSVGMLSIILSLIFCVLPDTHNDMVFNVIISLVPVSSVLIFGTQKDIFSAWASIVRIGRRRSHGIDTWETFTPIQSRQTIHLQAAEAS